MARHLVHGIDIQLIMIVHGNIGEDGGTIGTLMEFVLLIQILTASIIIVEVLTQFSGQT